MTKVAVQEFDKKYKKKNKMTIDMIWMGMGGEGSSFCFE